MEKYFSTNIQLYKSGLRNDSTPPNTTHHFNGTIGDNNWYITPVIITLNATDNESGVATIFYKVDVGDWSVYEDPFVVNEDGYHTLEYYSVDNTGNQEPAKGPFPFKIDQATPITTVSGTQGENGWYTSYNFTINAKDITSGIAATYIQIDHGTWMIYLGYPILFQDGEHMISFYSIDRAGNVEVVHNVTLKIDVIPPEITLNVKVLLNIWKFTAETSDVPSGVDRVEFYIDNQLIGTKNSSPYTCTWVWIGSSSHTVKAIVYDVAGNSATASKIIKSIPRNQSQNQMKLNLLLLRIMERLQQH